MKAALLILSLFLPCLAAAALPAALASKPVSARIPDRVAATDLPDIEPLFASPTRLDRIGRIVAPVFINGQGPFRLVVDTGASHTTISPALAATLGLLPQEGSTVVLNGVTGTEVVPAVTIDRLQAGDLIVEGSRVPVISTDIMAGADGILGVAGLKRERITVDFRRDRISISRSRSSAGTARMFRIPAIRLEGGLLMVVAHVGGVRVRAIIDTGAERSLGNIALRTALRNRNRLGAPRMTTVFGTTPAVAQGELNSVPPVILGGATVSDMDLVFGEFHVFKAWDLDAQPAMLIGMDVLGGVQQLIIDFYRREVYVLS
ncbi:MAG: aspartyl protease family protein [Gammaproteobacteria bacterium]